VSNEIKFRDDMTVQLVQSMGDDMSVVNAARVSTIGDAASPGENNYASSDLSSKDRGLINYLMRDRHGTPFEHNAFTFFVEAPIFVFREFMRHRVASYNEESGRYKELAPVFYIPNEERKLVQVGKPGAYTFEEGTYDQKKLVPAAMKRAVKESYIAYQEMLDKGVAREVARGVLPVNIYSSMFVTMNARALMNFLSLRTMREGTMFPSYPQREIEMVAEIMEDLFAEKMPVTYETFNKNGRVAP
jgi:thymidylate synthase (FAD)